jgi:hypothetical protein
MAKERTLSRSQAGTEYLVILGAVLLVAGTVVAILGFSASQGGGVMDDASKAYWQNAYPFTIKQFKLVNDSLVLELGYTGQDPAMLTDISLDGASPEWNSYLSISGGDYYGETLCPGGACEIQFSAGKTATIISKGGLGEQCATGGTSRFSIRQVKFTYSTSNLQGVAFTGIKPLEGTCTGTDVLSKVSACGNLAAPATFVLQNDNHTDLTAGKACINATSANAVLDCDGHLLESNNTESTYGFWTSKNGATIRNCNISNFSTAVYSSGNFTTISNNTITVKENTTNSSELWNGIWLSGGFYASVRGNNITNVSANNLKSNISIPYFPSGINLAKQQNSTIEGNNITAGGVSGMGIFLHSWSRFNTISNNVVKSTSSSFPGLLFQALYSSGLGNLASAAFNTYSYNKITASGSTSAGIMFNGGSFQNAVFNRVNVTGPGPSFGIILRLNNNLREFTVNNSRFEGNEVYTSGSGTPYSLFSKNGVNISFSSNLFNSSTGYGIASLNSTNLTFINGTVLTGSQNAIRLGWTLNPQEYSNSSASFLGGLVNCTSCARLVSVNQSSNASFLNVTMNASKLQVGDNASFGPNNITVSWYADIYVTKGGYPAAGVTVTSANSTDWDAFYDSATTDQNGLASFVVTEIVNMTPLGGYYATTANYTPHNFSVWEGGILKNWTWDNAGRTAYGVNVSGYTVFTITYT